MPTIHKTAHPQAGQTVTIQTGSLKGESCRIEDWWDRVSGESWMFADGNPACLDYASRSGLKDQLPIDDEVIYGKIGPFGKLIHASEITSDDGASQ